MPDTYRRRSPSPNHTSSRHHRSRSPNHTSSRHHRSRSPIRRERIKHGRSHEQTKEGPSHEHSSRSKPQQAPPKPLPLGARELTKYDLPVFKAMFGLYLDLQKEIDIDSLSEAEIKGRWKSFIGKWNRGELAEGWYDPETKFKADRSAITTDRIAQKTGKEPIDTSRRQSDTLPQRHEPTSEEQDEENDDDDYGPSLPPSTDRSLGPTIPRLHDLQHRNELSREDEEARREDLRYQRKQDRKSQKEALDDLVPRAQAGTRERQLEKKRDVAASNRAFKEANEPGTEEIGERDLMGGDEDGIKRHIKEQAKKKSERELRKEEALRAREAEREEKMQLLRDKEDKTMAMLKAIAKERFGAP